MPGEEDSSVTSPSVETGDARENGPVRKFTWKELSQLNRPHNIHVAVRGKVRVSDTAY